VFGIDDRLIERFEQHRAATRQVLARTILFLTAAPQGRAMYQRVIETAEDNLALTQANNVAASDETEAALEDAMVARVDGARTREDLAIAILELAASDRSRNTARASLPPSVKGRHFNCEDLAGVRQGLAAWRHKRRTTGRELAVERKGWHVEQQAAMQALTRERESQRDEKRNAEWAMARERDLDEQSKRSLRRNTMPF
jgi:hypothetical protein